MLGALWERPPLEPRADSATAGIEPLMLDLQPHREASFRLMRSSARRRQGDSKIMNAHHIRLGLAVLTSFGLGAAAMHQIHAQARPPAYVISEIEVTNPDAYNNEFVPLAVKALAAGGQKRLAAGGKTIALAGPPQASRVVLSVFENLDMAQAAYNSPAYLEARKIGEKYGKLRTFAVEGLPQ